MAHLVREIQGYPEVECVCLISLRIESNTFKADLMDLNRVCMVVAQCPADRPKVESD